MEIREKMEKEIAISRATVTKIRKIFGCTTPTIQRALKGEANTLLKIRIREAAKKLGGKYVIYEEIEK